MNGEKNWARYTHKSILQAQYIAIAHEPVQLLIILMI